MWACYWKLKKLKLKDHKQASLGLYFILRHRRRDIELASSVHPYVTNFSMRRIVVHKNHNPFTFLNQSYFPLLFVYDVTFQDSISDTIEDFYMKLRVLWGFYHTSRNLHPSIYKILIAGDTNSKTILVCYETTVLLTCIIRLHMYLINNSNNKEAKNINTCLHLC